MKSAGSAGGRNQPKGNTTGFSAHPKVMKPGIAENCLSGALEKSFPYTTHHWLGFPVARLKPEEWGRSDNVLTCVAGESFWGRKSFQKERMLDDIVVC